ncbi:Taurine hydroxylase-like protein SAT17 like [Verticillium longisporum]|nr:Taurine hydroxylase-like protein SAT17 like [Verticillium longisporum]
MKPHAAIHRQLKSRELSTQASQRPHPASGPHAQTSSVTAATMSFKIAGPALGYSQMEFKDHGCNGPAADMPGLPGGFSAVLNTESSWTGQDFSLDSRKYILNLSAADIKELENALEMFKNSGQDGDNVTRDTFDLPVLGDTLCQVSQDVNSGRGFAVVRGLDPRKYCVEDLTLLYLGIQVYIANEQGRQDKKGNMLVHIIADNSTAQHAEHHRHSTSSITFHNEEAGDVVSWLTRSTAVAGGKCIIASGHTVYNVLANTRPDIIRTLARSDWPFALPRFHCRPILFNHQGKVIINFGRAPLLGSAAHPRPEHLPALSARQVEALDAVEAIAQATQLEIQTQAGDMHFINNLVVLHRREGFVNGEGSHEKRHLVRMILRDSQLGWAIPDELKRDWFDAFEKDADRAWHLEPMPEGFFPLRINTN